MNFDQLSKASKKTLLAVADATVHDAAMRLLRRKERLEHPEGKIDNGGRFYLARNFDCCSGIRAPSRGYPWSEMVHGRSAVHVAHELGIGDRASDVRRYSLLMKKHPELKTSFGPTRALVAREAAQRVLEDMKAGKL
ncbi:MAG: hypothetical protein V4787_02175 [Pseudomonadota bacterium]